MICLDCTLISKADALAHCRDNLAGRATLGYSVALDLLGVGRIVSSFDDVRGSMSVTHTQCDHRTDFPQVIPFHLESRKRWQRAGATMHIVRFASKLARQGDGRQAPVDGDCGEILLLLVSLAEVSRVASATHLCGAGFETPSRRKQGDRGFAKLYQFSKSVICSR